jgi:exodeoxyribonuclease VII small subunit
MTDVSHPSRETETPSYERARDELAAIVEALEGGGQTLEQALTLWERGEVLAQVCQSWLDNARERLETVRASQTEAAPSDPIRDS